DFVQVSILGLSSFDRLGPILPKPPHCIGKNHHGMFAIMPALAPNVLHFIACELESAFHALVCHPPVAPVDVQVITTVLEENPNRFWLELPNQRRINMPTAKPDIGAD